MSDQLTIVETGPKLTPRQQAVHQALQAAGQDGLHADEAGAVAHEQKEGRWAHSRDERCQWCGKDGKQILHALRAKGLARYRSKLKAWQASTIESEPVVETPQPDFSGAGPVPYNAFPVGF
jgi:hypothetical protein